MPDLLNRPTITQTVPTLDLVGRLPPGPLNTLVPPPEPQPEVVERSISVPGESALSRLGDALVALSFGPQAALTQRAQRRSEIERELEQQAKPLEQQAALNLALAQLSSKEDIAKERLDRQAAIEAFRAQAREDLEKLRQEAISTRLQEQLEAQAAALDQRLEQQLALQRQAFQNQLALLQLQLRDRQPTEEDIETLAEALERGELTPQGVKQEIRPKVIQKIRDRGGVILTPKQREALQKVIKVGGIINEIEAISKRVNTASGGLSLLVGVGRKSASFAGLDPEASQLDATKAVLGPLARSISEEVGVLTDRDVARVQAAVPTVFDSKEKAQAKLSVLRRFQRLAQKALQLTAGAKLTDIETIKRELEQWRQQADSIELERTQPQKELSPEAQRFLEKFKKQ